MSDDVLAERHDVGSRVVRVLWKVPGDALRDGKSALHRQVSAAYFGVLGIPLRAGRAIDAGDAAGPWSR